MTAQHASRHAIRLQIITLAWMLVELGVSAWSAFTAHSPAMLAFGSDSLVETLSAATVLSQWAPGIKVSERRAARITGALLFVLAAVVVAIAVGSYVFHVQPDTTLTGIVITACALLAMPVLARMKRREAARTGNAAMSADAVQSATCAYIAGIALVGLILRATLGIAWFDSLAALIAIPFLLKEGREAWRGNSCCCC
jgi:divalent metal cation (Fe/Co/Zn/Cd) transporter